MDIKNLAKVSDSLFGEKSEILKKKKSDAVKTRFAAKLRRAIKDEADLEEVALAELDNSSPEEVISSVAEVLRGVVEDLNKTADAVKQSKTAAPAPLKIGDANWKKAFRTKLMDTESTEDVIELAKAELAVTDPGSVIETVIEVLDDVIENLEGGVDE